MDLEERLLYLEERSLKRMQERREFGNSAIISHANQEALKAFLQRTNDGSQREWYTKQYAAYNMKWPGPEVELGDPHG